MQTPPFWQGTELQVSSGHSPAMSGFWIKNTGMVLKMGKMGPRSRELDPAARRRDHQGQARAVRKSQVEDLNLPLMLAD